MSCASNFIRILLFLEKLYGILGGCHFRCDTVYTQCNAMFDLLSGICLNWHAYNSCNLRNFHQNTNSMQNLKNSEFKNRKVLYT